MSDLKSIVNNYSPYYTTPKKDVEKLFNRMIKLKNKGLSYIKIGKQLNISASTVWNYLNKYKEKNA